MRHAINFTVLWTIAAGVLIGGCARPDRAKMAAPIHSELPDLTKADPSLPVGVGVERRGERPRLTLVRIEQPELTPEEKEALGEEEYALDLLALYEPPRGPEQGVFPFDTRLDPGIAELGGAQVGYDFPHWRVGVFGYANRNAGVAPFDREVSGGARGFAATGAGVWSEAFTQQVGIGPSRMRAGRAPRFGH